MYVCAYLQYKLPIIHDTRIQVSLWVIVSMVISCLGMLQQDITNFALGDQLALYICCSIPRQDITIIYVPG